MGARTHGSEEQIDRQAEDADDGDTQGGRHGAEHPFAMLCATMGANSRERDAACYQEVTAKCPDRDALSHPGKRVEDAEEYARQSGDAPHDEQNPPEPAMGAPVPCAEAIRKLERNEHKEDSAESDVHECRDWSGRVLPVDPPHLFCTPTDVGFGEAERGHRADTHWLKSDREIWQVSRAKNRGTQPDKNQEHEPRPDRERHSARNVARTSCS
ncbi:MAG: hypothetical protein ABIZ91_00620 [Gemmatimonadaceae bacterium]